MLKLKSWQLGAAVLIVIFGGILLTTAFNIWTTETSKIPAKFETGDATGEYRPDDIRGSYTFADISALYQIPPEDLVAAFLIPEDADLRVFACKDLENQYLFLEETGMEIGTSSVRLFVALYTGLPYAIDEETHLLQPAVEILKQKAALTPEQLGYLEAHTIALDHDFDSFTVEEDEMTAQTDPVEDVSTDEPVSEEHVEETDRLIKGKTTFREVLDWGVSQDAIERILGEAMPSPLMIIKDYCLEQGLEFSDIKNALQAEVDAAGQ